MKAMKGVILRGGVYQVRITIPKDIRDRYGVTEEVRSLGTGDQIEAIRVAGPHIADIKNRIRELRNPAAVVAVKRPVARLNPQTCFDLIQSWRHDEIDALYHDAFNGEPVRHGDPTEASRFRYALSHYSTITEIDLFDARLADVLDIKPDHPVVQRKNVREWFREAWFDIETFRERFAADDFNGWPEDDAPAIPATTPTPPAPVEQAGMKLSELRDAWDAVKPLEPKQKGYIRRLIEHLGDVDIATVTPVQMDRFLVELKRFPLSRKPADDKLLLADLLAKYDGTDQPRLSEWTLYVWTTVYKGLFEHAVTRRLLTHNPAHKMMTKPTRIDAARTEYGEADLDFLFTRPLFKGFDGPADFGYRDKPGRKVVKDGKYWLPILAIHSGMRLDEMATLTKAELIERDGILAFDLTARPLTGRSRVKNATSRRLVPIHRRLIDLGFVEWARSSRDPEGFIFADLKFDKRGKRGSQFSKWWGLWCNQNADAEGQGIANPLLTFHSFRHTFKRAARETVERDIHDILTGHTDGSVSAAYGRGVSLTVLKDAMDKIEIRWP